MLMEWVTDDKYNIEWIAALSEQVTFLGLMHAPSHLQPDCSTQL